jgi:hypothetical protein
MHYMVALKAKSYEQDNEWFYFRDSLLAAESDFKLLECSVCEELGLCRHCPCDHYCHILMDIGGGTYKKLCLVLFVDLVRPPFRIDDIIN